MFRSVTGCGGSWRRFRCPAFGDLDLVRPRDVEALIRWITEPGETPLEVDYNGAPR